MKYTFKEMLNADIYESTKVMFVLGQYMLFNNLVCDELKAMCIEDNPVALDSNDEISGEFGLGTDSEYSTSNSVDFNTFMEVVTVPSINGKWYCKVDLASLSKKQKDQLFSYIKSPTDNGILVVSSNDWKVYKDVLKNRVLSFSKVSHIMQLSFPSKDVLKIIVQQLFADKGIDIQPPAIEYFMLRMSSAYDKYEDVIDNIVTNHKSTTLELSDIKNYMSGIENFILNDLVMQLPKPMTSDKTNSKKVLKVLMYLEEEFTAKGVLYKLLNIIDECIEFRVLINSGKIPMGINYFYKDVIDSLGGEKSKYGKMKEWTFRNKANLASQTSLRDWVYMKLILEKAIDDVKVSDVEMDAKCQKALYELCTRSVLYPDRINNIIGVKNVLEKTMEDVNNIVYSEDGLRKIIEDETLANFE